MRGASVPRRAPQRSLAAAGEVPAPGSKLSADTPADRLPAGRPPEEPNKEGEEGVLLVLERNTAEAAEAARVDHPTPRTDWERPEQNQGRGPYEIMNQPKLSRKRI